MFAKTTLASAVAAALGVSAVGIQTAQADSVFFPYVGAGSTVTTVITTINTSTADAYNEQIGKIGPYLHYRLYYKSAGTDARESSCTELDEFHPTSKNDIQTFDLSGHFGAETLGVLFNDPSVQNEWVKDNTSFAMGAQAMSALGESAFRGYMVIDNGDASLSYTLAGEAFLFEFNSGAVWGYQAERQSGAVDPDSGVGADYRASASGSPTNVGFLPFAESTTAFFVTPVSEYQAPPSINEYVAKIGLANIYYDRDERPLSSGQNVSVTCVGRVEAKELMSDAGARIPDGGWGAVTNTRTLSDVNVGFTAAGGANDTLSLSSAVTTAGAVVIKLDYNDSTAPKFNDEATAGIYNNGYLLEPGQNTWVAPAPQ